MDGAGWRWVHRLVIPFLELCPLNKCFEVKNILKQKDDGNKNLNCRERHKSFLIWPVK